MAAIIYTRFSPRPDADICDSCETQRRICQEHAEKNGWPVSLVIEDPDVSGADECRPKLIEAVNSLRRGDVLLVYRFDRIARNVYLFETVNRKIINRGARIVAVSGDVQCGDEAISTLVRQILAAIAEYERKMIARRVSDAMQAKQREGRRMSARLPYGWRVDPGDDSRMVADDTEQATINAIRLMAAGGMGICEIARTLDPATARSGKWYAAQVKRILERRY